MTTNLTDHGEITETIPDVKETLGHDIVEVVADKGYQDPTDMAKALASGIVPNVIQRDGGNVSEVEFSYCETEISDEMLNSKDPKDIEACLKAGRVPQVYAGILDSANIVDVSPTKVLLQVSSRRCRTMRCKTWHVMATLSGMQQKIWYIVLKGIY